MFSQWLNKGVVMKTRVASFSKTNWLVLPLAVCTLSACVTINIYFPAAAAEKAADKIIEEVWQTQKGDKAVPKANENQSGAPDTKKEEAK